MTIDSLEPIIFCNKCHVARITFDNNRKGKQGKLIPLQYRDPTQIHICDQSSPFECRRCHELIYLDQKVLSKMSNTRIPLDMEGVNAGRPHECTGIRNRNVDDV